IPEARIKDNASGCLCRMILAHPDRVPLAQVLPALVDLLPLKEDYEENTPVYQCIYKLYEQGEPTINSLTSKVIPVLESVLSPPEDQLTDETRELVRKLVHNLYSANQALFAANPNALKLAGIL